MAERGTTDHDTNSIVNDFVNKALENDGSYVDIADSNNSFDLDELMTKLDNLEEAIDDNDVDDSTTNYSSSAQSLCSSSHTSSRASSSCSDSRTSLLESEREDYGGNVFVEENYQTVVKCPRRNQSYPRLKNLWSLDHDNESNISKSLGNDTVLEKPKKRRSASCSDIKFKRPRKKRAKRANIVDFLYFSLLNKESSHVKWVNKSKGIFKVIDKGKTLELWSTKKRKPTTEWDNFVRSLRHHYKEGNLEEESTQLTWKFTCAYLSTKTGSLKDISME